MKKPIIPYIALILDLAIGVLTVYATIVMFQYGGLVLADQGYTFLKYFTVQSNILAGIMGFVAFTYELLFILGKIKKIQPWVKVAYFAANAGTFLTFLTVVAFLGPTLGYPMMYDGANLYYHLIIPLLVFIRVAFFEIDEGKLRLRDDFFCLVHMGIYGIVYLINVLVHNGYGVIEYDWYGFGQWGLGIGLALFAACIAGAFLTGLGTMFLQNKIRAIHHRPDHLNQGE